jgi:hypothetical protein
MGGDVKAAAQQQIVMHRRVPHLGDVMSRGEHHRAVQQSESGVHSRTEPRHSLRRRRLVHAHVVAHEYARGDGERARQAVQKRCCCGAHDVCGECGDTCEGGTPTVRTRAARRTGPSHVQCNAPMMPAAKPTTSNAAHSMMTIAVPAHAAKPCEHDHVRQGMPVLKRQNHSLVQHSTAQHSTAQHSTAQHSTAQHSTAQHSTAQASPLTHLGSRVAGTVSARGTHATSTRPTCRAGAGVAGARQRAGSTA